MIIESLPHLDLFTCLICVCWGSLLHAFLDYLIGRYKFERHVLTAIVILAYAAWTLVFFAYALLYEGLPDPGDFTGNIITALSWCARAFTHLRKS